MIRFWDWIEGLVVAFFGWSGKQHWIVRILVLCVILGLIGLVIYLSGAHSPEQVE
jgi:hypothetical protein